MATLIQPRPFEPKKALFVTAVLVAFFLFTYTREPPPRAWSWQGGIMGTTYTVKVIDTEHRVDVDGYKQLGTALQARLDELNRQMSTYLVDSDIMAVNRASAGQPVAISNGFLTVTRAALVLAADTRGAFDPTLDPLIELWGFGREGPTRTPSPAEVAETRARTGPASVRLDRGQILKTRDDVRLNLNAIAKGYAADDVVRLLVDQHLTNVFVEIGGEVACLGHNLGGGPWRIGVDVPDPELPPGDRFAVILAVDRGGVATSGDYRNFFEDDAGRRRSHILDPATGEPADTDVAAVTVVAETCMLADGVATALFVMGSERGLAWVEQRADVEALFQIHDDDGFTTVASDGFAAYVLD